MAAPRKTTGTKKRAPRKAAPVRKRAVPTTPTEPTPVLEFEPFQVEATTSKPRKATRGRKKAGRPRKAAPSTELVAVEKSPVSRRKPRTERQLTVAQEAHKLVGDRRKEYGGALESMTRIANLWSEVYDTSVTPQQVGLSMILLKVSRAIKQGQHIGRDTLVDIAGYAELLEMVESELVDLGR
jgi:hypothetical protein